MAAKTTKKPEPAEEPKRDDGQRDRVAMLSVRADGTPDQINPELIGGE